MSADWQLFDLPGVVEPVPGESNTKNTQSVSGEKYLIFSDGGSRGNPGVAGFGAVICQGDTAVALCAEYVGETTNNVAEYMGLVAGLKTVFALNPQAIVQVRADSKLVIEQMSGRWKIKHPQMQQLALEAKRVFPPGAVDYQWIPREQNKAADALANLAMDTKGPVDKDQAWAVVAGFLKVAPVEPAKPLEPVEPANPVEQVKPIVKSSEMPAQGRLSGLPVRKRSGPSTNFVFVRHGTTQWTHLGRYSGGDDCPGPALDDIGQAQVSQAATIVGQIGQTIFPDLPVPTVLLSSPLQRALDTAQVLGLELGLDTTVEQNFSEVRFGSWQGMVRADIEKQWPGGPVIWATTWDNAPPGGENMQEVTQRVAQALHQCQQEYAGKTVVVATHNVVIRTAVGHSAKWDIGSWYNLRVPPASVTVMRCWQDGAFELSALSIPCELAGLR